MMLDTCVNVMRMAGNMCKWFGDVFDDIGCFFSRHDFDRLAAFFATCAEVIDPARIDEGYVAK